MTYEKKHIQAICQALSIASIENLKEHELDALTDVVNNIYEDGYSDGYSNGYSDGESDTIKEAEDGNIGKTY